MFKDVQRLKIADLQNQIARIQNKQSILEDPANELEDLIMRWEKYYARGPRYDGKKDFNKWERLVSHRKEYQTYMQDFQQIPEKIAALKVRLETTKQGIAQENDRLKQEIDQLEMQILRIKKATTLVELKVHPAEAVTMLENHGITPILDESDKTIFEHPRNYESTADLIAVHKTKFMPTGSRLSTLKELGVEATKSVTIDGQEYHYNFQLERNTVHFAMNGEVSSHMFGNWDQCKYTVLNPFVTIGAEIGSHAPNDTYTRGGCELNRLSWILCPADEVAEVKKQNPCVHVLGYQGENSNGLAAPFLSQLGYRAEYISSHKWPDSQSMDQYMQIMRRKGVSTEQHCNTTDSEDEDYLIQVNQLIGLMKMLRNNNLVQSVEDYKRIKPQLESQIPLTKLFVDVLTKNTITSQSERGIDPKAVVANGRHAEIFIQKMYEAGMGLSALGLELIKTKHEDLQNDTNYTQQIGWSNQAAVDMCNLPVGDLVERITVSSMINSRTQETERSM